MNQERGGIPCPICEALIVISLADLLRRTTFRCRCGLELRLDRHQSRASLDAVIPLKGAIEQLNAIKKRYR
jgi:hypothetical protein